MAKDTDLGVQGGMERDAAYDKVKSKQEGSAKAKGVLRGAGYARGGGVAPAKSMHKHEKKSEKETKFKQGGKVDGKKPHERADKYKRGGSVPRGHTKININMAASEADKAAAMKKGVQVGAQLAARKMAGARPGAGAPMQARPMPGGPPPGAGGPPPNAPGPQPQMKRGGAVRVAGVPHLKGGAGGAKGRMSKIASYGTKPKA